MRESTRLRTVECDNASVSPERSPLTSSFVLFHCMRIIQATSPPDQLVIEYGPGEIVTYDIVDGLNVTIPRGLWHKVVSTDPNSERALVSVKASQAMP